jgi:hypothetical protein
VFLAFLLMPLDSVVRWIGYAAGVVAAFAIVVALHYAFRRPIVLRLDAEGYDSRTRSSGGRFSGRWLDVEDVEIVEGVLRLRTNGGAVQQMPLDFFGRDQRRLLRDVNERLNAANGYRRFGGEDLRL